MSNPFAPPPERGRHPMHDITHEAAALYGKPELAREILSGTISAPDLAPLLAGMIEGLLRLQFIPVARARGFASFEPGEPGAPMTAAVTLPDGSEIIVTVQGVPNR